MWQESYKFIDDFYACAIFNEEDICGAVRHIESEKQKEAEEMQRMQSRESALESLNNWIYMEDEQVEELLNKLKQELRDGIYVISHYQDKLNDFVFFKRLGFCVEDDLKDV